MEKYLLINSGESLKFKLLRVDKSTKLILRPGPKFQELNITIETNYPTESDEFVRSTYKQIHIKSDHQDVISSSFNWHASILLKIAGTFHFVCLNTSRTQIWEAWIVVNPDIKIPLDSIKCQTVLSKNLGPFIDWRKRLALAKNCKFNFVHFTPVQELGSSNSAYCIRHQHKVNPNFGATLDDIKKEVDFMDKKWNILSITDIVLNHTADDSGWIREHPECAYNVSNSPHLRPAFLLDSALVQMAKDICSGELSQLNFTGPELDLETLGHCLRDYVPYEAICDLFMISTQSRLDDIQSRGSIKVDYNYMPNGAKLISIPENIKSQHELSSLIDQENLKKRNEIKGYIKKAIENVISTICYERLDPQGPYYHQPISEQAPLVAPYFTHSKWENFDSVDEQREMLEDGRLFMAHNGWVMGAASTEDFASPNSHVYLKRELVAWGDCIKLRYGSAPSDVPYLWKHMEQYVKAQAKVFHGFRIDNCHSTPLHVAEYFVDAARSLRPDIYIMAELFTSSEASDNEFVNRLGLTSLIREAMSASNARELCRSMYRYGGTPLGAFYQQGAEPLKPSIAHAIFYDQTHDNESPVVKKSAHDVGATTSIINMANCATGSSRGHDELVPHHINVVTEERLYPIEVDENAGILPVRRILNGVLLRELSQGFSEIFVDQVNEDVIAITRHNPIDGRSIVLIARTAFSKEPGPCPPSVIPIQGQITRVLFEAQACGDPSDYTRDEKFIKGLSSFNTKVFSTGARADEAKLAKIVQLSEDKAEIRLDEFSPSSVLAVEVSLSPGQTEGLRVLNQWDINLSRFELTLSDANYILFRCPQEDDCGSYELPNFATFTYCGLYGLMYHLEKVRENQDQAHPLAENLRNGNWLGEYILARLRERQSLKPLADHLELALRQLDILPRGMVPKYFDLIITKFYEATVELIFSRMSVFVNKGPKLVKLLSLSSVALIGECESAQLPPIEAKIPYIPSLAAGLPHFACGYMRNWGRDTFIALRGLLLMTGRFSEAKSIILSYARTLHHGLIPNLLDGGTKARYNCRDATWWWLYSIREYTKLAPNGSEILRSKIKRIKKPAAGVPQRRRSVAQMNGGGDSSQSSQQLCDVVQEALECHFRGIDFVEEGAGKRLDEHMQQRGFRVTAGVNRETGFVFGGNEFNCGTWMDKMGSSEKARTKGKPASPRDGSAVEIVGLCKAVVSWLDDMFKNGRAYPYDGVECLYDNTITLKWNWKKWASLIQANFEKFFYIPLENERCEDPRPDLINRRGIYKDTLGASITWQDYQLRPNFLVAMVVAPELFNKEHAVHALELVKKHLCGPLGMKTLDPSDWNYCGDYDNANDSENPKLAHGYNYHQGPEWLWLTGYYIRASSKFLGAAERSHHLKLLANFYATLVESPWLGLPELTNKNGAFCPHSCPIQAWSLGTALEALHESVRNV